MLITLSGLDGSGKSTLIRSLRTALEARNNVVVVCHMNHDIGVYAAAKAMLGRLRGSCHITADSRPPRASAERHVGRWQRLRYALVWNKPLRRLLYLPDLLIFLVFRFYVERVQGRILIMDRYFYDTLVDVAGPAGSLSTRLLARLTPTPSLAVLLDVAPELAFERKGEFSVEYLRRRSLTYRHIFGGVPSAIVLNPHDVGRSTAQLEHLVAQRARQ